MLVSLHVKDIALIKETEVLFGPSLNILTGETGAGKSIIIGSINLALGAKADKDIIRRDAEYALVELLFKVDDEAQKEQLRQMDIEVDDDNMLIIQRKIMANRSVSKINGETVIAKQLKQVASVLIDIHSQHEHQSLLVSSKQKHILDDYAGEQLSFVLGKIRTVYQEYKQVIKELEEGQSDAASRKRELDLFMFEAKEIEDAMLKPGEDDTLETEYRKMANSQKISASISGAYELIAGDSEGCSAAVSRALREVKSVAQLDEALQDLESQLMDIDALLHDFGRQAYDYIESLTYDPYAFAEVESRLNVINHLKDKYGTSIEKILEYGDSLSEKIEKLQNYDAYVERLTNQKIVLYKELLVLCEEASQIRKEGAAVLSEQMKNALIDLNFKDVQFEIAVTADTEQIAADGYDAVEYRISTNPGEALKPLSQVASGGELSRVMLALKTVLADRDHIETLIFDEIDAGISGKTAWKVAEKIGTLGKAHQVICITHLPQIAAMADSHFLIEKQVTNGETITGIEEVKEEDSIEELARLLGGETITQINRENAKEMKEAALQIKK